MRPVCRLTIAAGAAALAAGVSGNAFATDEPFGRHVSMCAQTSLGKRATPPAVTCTHDGHVPVFATFGEMVQDRPLDPFAVRVPRKRCGERPPPAGSVRRGLTES